MNQKQQPPWLVNILFYCDEEKRTRNDSEKNSTSYNTKEITVITRKPTVTNQRAQEVKWALQQYSRTTPEEKQTFTQLK